MYKYKSGAISIRRVHIDLSSYQIGYPSANIQPQTRTLFEIVQFFKTFKDSFNLVCRDATTGIGNGKFPFSGFPAIGKDNISFLSVFAGIGEKVRKDLPQSGSIRT